MPVVPGSEGDFGVLHGHAPLISTVRPGVLEVFQGSKADQRFLVAGGIAEVTPERCTVLADEAVPFESVTAEQLAAQAGGDPELAFKILEHLAANGGAKKTAKTPWYESTYTA